MRRAASSFSIVSRRDFSNDMSSFLRSSPLSVASLKVRSLSCFCSLIFLASFSSHSVLIFSAFVFLLFETALHRSMTLRISVRVPIVRYGFPGWTAIERPCVRSASSDAESREAVEIVVSSAGEPVASSTRTPLLLLLVVVVVVVVFLSLSSSSPLLFVFVFVFVVVVTTAILSILTTLAIGPLVSPSAHPVSSLRHLCISGLSSLLSATRPLTNPL